MSRSLKAVAVIAAISVAALIVWNLPGGAGDKRGPFASRPVGQVSNLPGSNPNLVALTEDESPEPTARPRSKSGPKHPHAPLQHAIVKDEEDSAEAEIAKALDRPTTVEFIDSPLEDCFSFLREFHKINIWLDRGALTDEGVALDQPITLKLTGVRLESILNLLLGPVQLDWIIQDEVLKITTRAKADELGEVRTYDVQNLLDSGHTPEELIASITKCVAPGTWTGEDASGGISHTGGVLIVRQSQRTHAEVASVLEDLDRIADAEEEERADAKRNTVVSVKVYPTGKQPADQVAQCLQDFVEIKSWQSRGGSGKVRPLTGALVIEQTAAVHQSIQRFLAQLLPKSSAAPGNPAASGAAAQPGAGPGANSPDPFGVLKSAAPSSGSNAGGGFFGLRPESRTDAAAPPSRD